MRHLVFSTVLALTLSLGQLFAADASPQIQALQAAAAKGDPVAEQELGRAYNLGQGVPLDFSKALDLYRKSAAQGNAKAMNNLGIMYHKGQGVPADDKEASKWLLQAADKDLPSAELAVGLAYREGDLGFPKDGKLAEKWLTSAVQHDDEPKVVAPAANALGALYEYGAVGGKTDYVKAMSWYQKAADLNFAMGQTNLGNLYYIDLAGKKDLVKAYMWFRLAAEQDEPKALHLISVILDGHELTDAQMTEADKRANEFRAAHHEYALPAEPKHIDTPEQLMARDALKRAEVQWKTKHASGTNAAPAALAPVASTGTK
jgi:TPR repeat protein